MNVVAQEMLGKALELDGIAAHNLETWGSAKQRMCLEHIENVSLALNDQVAICTLKQCFYLAQVNLPGVEFFMSAVNRLLAAEYAANLPADDKP
jgi:hypothetical protein